jgi:hypothetical protein
MFKSVISLYPVLKIISKYLKPFEVVALYYFLDIKYPNVLYYQSQLNNVKSFNCVNYKPLNYKYLDFKKVNLDTINWDVCCRHKIFTLDDVVLYIKYLNLFRLRLIFIFNPFSDEEKRCIISYFKHTAVYLC